MSRYGFSLVAAAALCAAAGSAHAAIFTGQAGDRAASVEFVVNGNDLVVTLTNTATADALVPIDILTAVFFDLPGDPITLTVQSAVLAGGSIVLFGTSDPGGVVGGEWAYNDGFTGGPGGATHGISSAGFGPFGPSNRFPGNNLQGPDGPDGLQYGITSAGDNPATGNGAVTGGNALIQNSVVFTLSGVPDGLDPDSISNVSFQYGTAFGEPNVPGVPTPGTGALLAAGIVISLRRRR